MAAPPNLITPESGRPPPPCRTSERYYRHHCQKSSYMGSYLTSLTEDSPPSGRGAALTSGCLEEVAKKSP